MTDYYETLGIERDADAAAIKAAYRKRAKETHPDHGGNAAEMQAVNEAYEVLSDPARRAQYDETGSGKMQDTDRLAEERLHKLFTSYLESDEDYRGDLILKFRETVESAIRHLQGMRPAIERKIARMERQLDRVSGGDLFRTIAQKRLEQHRLSLVHLAEEIETNHKVVQLLINYKDVSPRALPSQFAYMGGDFQNMFGNV